MITQVLTQVQSHLVTTSKEKDFHFHSAVNYEAKRYQGEEDLSVKTNAKE